ncbi:hypothetical protein Droror1_Dr00022836 [Drosera rotundifolia]
MQYDYACAFDKAASTADKEDVKERDGGLHEIHLRISWRLEAHIPGVRHPYCVGFGGRRASDREPTDNNSAADVASFFLAGKPHSLCLHLPWMFMKQIQRFLKTTRY